MFTSPPAPLLLTLLLLLPLIRCKTGSEIRPSEIRAVAESSSHLAAELSVILGRLREGSDQGGREDTISQLNNKIEILEKQLRLKISSQEEEDEEKRDDAKNSRSQKFRQMLRQFYLGDHYDFSL